LKERAFLVGFLGSFTDIENIRMFIAYITPNCGVKAQYCVILKFCPIKKKEKMTFARIEILNARKVNTSIIFRRGPSKWVQLLKWNTETDEIIEGQWFKGRIYSKKSDLSPCGNYLIYFAAKFKEKKNQYAWTAISKPPYLTAIAMWRKSDTFDGGGLFENVNKLYLNHRRVDYIPEINSNLKNLQITLNKTNWPEIYDIEGAKMKRDKWEWSKVKSVNINNSDIQITKKFNIETSIIHTGNRLSCNKYNWNSFIKYKEELLNFDGYENINVNIKNRILLSKNGCIFSLDDIDTYLKSKELKLIVDLNSNKPYEMSTPEEMKKW